MDIPHFVNTLTCWWVFDLYPVWAIINKVALNILVNVFVWANNFISLGQISENRMAGSYGQRMFKFLTNSASVFYNGCAGFHSHQQCMKRNYIPFGAAIYSLNYFMLIDGTFNIFYTSVIFFLSYWHFNRGDQCYPLHDYNCLLLLSAVDIYFMYSKALILTSVT